MLSLNTHKINRLWMAVEKFVCDTVENMLSDTKMKLSTLTGVAMTTTETERELWVLGLGDDKRGDLVRNYLQWAGYRSRTAGVEELAAGRPLGVVLDLSVHSTDGWGILLTIKSSPETRNIPVLPVYLSEEGKVGGVFPISGFFTLPVDGEYFAERLAVLGLLDDVDDYDFQALVIARKREEEVGKTLETLGFEVVNAYTGKEGLALATTSRQYIIFCALMLSDMVAFELMERFRLYPQTRNIPFFVFIKESMKEGERLAMSRQIEPLVRKKEMSRDEFITHFRRRA
jgi:CheY-like chemotaxis protein